jgi:hypothetical protein
MEPGWACLRTCQDGHFVPVRRSAEFVAWLGFACYRWTDCSTDRNRPSESFHLLHWYIRWWPELLIGAGFLALGEWWFDRNHYCSNGARIALIIGCLALLVSDHGSFGIYVSGHLMNAEDLAHLLTRK